MRSNNPESTKPHHSIMEVSRPYRAEYAHEVGRQEWDELDIVYRMNFAKVYGFLTPRQAAAFEEARAANAVSEDPLPPAGVGFLAEIYFEDNAFRPDLIKGSE